MKTQEKQSIHLPYVIDEKKDRNHFYENHWKRVALNLLEEEVSQVSGLTLLDYGCGRGETLEYAKALGIDAYGLDVDPECVSQARTKGRADILNLENTSEQIGCDSYDIVACFHVLEHVENPKECLTMLAKCARKYVITAVPNLRLLHNLRRPTREPNSINPGHLQSWDHAHFRNLAENHCGLRIVSWGHDATVLPVLSELSGRVFGRDLQIQLETGLFRRFFPFNGISVIALMEPIE